MDYIRKYYKVPAKRGGRVIYTGGTKPQYGTILGASGAYLVIRLDGHRDPQTFHPTWRIEYQ